MRDLIDALLYINDQRGGGVGRHLAGRKVVLHAGRVVAGVVLLHLGLAERAVRLDDRHSACRATYFTQGHASGEADEADEDEATPDVPATPSTVDLA